jgi:hypothetical protein
MKTGLGGAIDGTLAEYGTFSENGLVDMPPSLNYLEGKPCLARHSQHETLYMASNHYNPIMWY